MKKNITIQKPKNNGTKKITIVKRANKRKINKNFKIKTPKKRETEISWEETVYNVSSSIDFNTHKIAIQPGLSSSFTWLANNCANWEYYRFENLSYRYIPSVNMVNPNASGNVILSFDSDPDDPAPQSTLVTQNATKKVYGAPYKNMLLFLNSRDLNKQNPKSLIRMGPVPFGQTINVYDSGNVYISTSGQVANDVTLGSIVAKYTVKLFNPEVKTNTLSTNSMMLVVNSVNIIPATEINNDYLMSLAETVTNGIDCTIEGDTITFPPGKFFIQGRFLFIVRTGYHLTSAYLYYKINGVFPPLSDYVTFTEPSGDSPNVITMNYSNYYESSTPFTVVFYCQSSEYTTTQDIGVEGQFQILRVG